MHKFEIIRDDLDEKEMEWYATVNPGYIPTGYTLHHESIDRYGLPYSEDLVIFKAADRKHNWTPYGMARQTSKYIIIARWDRYYKLTLKGEIVSLDAEDNNSNR